MPDGDEAEDGEDVEDGAEAADSAAAGAAAEGDVEIADGPAVEGAVPAAPEGEGGVVVGHAPDHVLGRVDAVGEGPEAEEAPGEEELEPDDVEVEVAEHGELEGRVQVPFWVGF